MKDWLQSFNREQVACAAGLALAAMLLLAGVAGGGPAAPDVSARAAVREYSPRPVLQPPVPQGEFRHYWGGRNVFQTEGSSQLPIPTIAAPLPRDENPPFPLFRPHPPLEEYHRRVAVKYPSFGSKPVVAESDLPPAADLDSLKTLEEPAPNEFRDQSQEQERECCVILWIPETKRSPTEGFCVGGCARGEDSGEMIEFAGKDRKSKMKWKRSEIKEIQHSWKNLDQYKFRAAKIPSGAQEPDDRTALARWCFERGMLESAVESSRRALELRKDHAGAILFLGEILEEEGDFDGAVAHYQGAIDAAPSMKDELRWRIGECLRKLGLAEAAVEWFARSAEAPRFFKGRVSHARMLLDLGAPERTVEILGDLLSKFSSDTVNLTPELRLAATALRGRAYLRTGNLSAAVADLEAAGRPKEKPPGTSGIVAEALNASGACLAFEGRWKDAAAAFVSAIREDQYVVEAWINLAAICGLAGKLADAEALYGAAARRDPSAVDAAAGLALCRLLAGKSDEAGKQIDGALAIDPSDPYANVLKGSRLLGAGKSDEALAAFRTALRADPLFAPAHVGAAGAYLRNADARLAATARVEPAVAPSDRAVGGLGPVWGEIAREAIRIIPEALRGGAREDLVRAEALYRKAIDLQPRSINLQVALGCVYALLGRTEEARARLDQAKMLVSEAGLRSDPIVEYAFGYLRYRYGTEEVRKRLAEAQAYFKTAADAKDYGDPASQRVIREAAEMGKRIEDWRLTSLVVEETFDRPDSESMRWEGSRWIEKDQKPRTPIKVAGKRCLFTGEPGEDWIPSRLERDDLPVEEFHRLEATFSPEAQATSTFEFGVSIYAPQIQGANTRYGIHIGFDRQRRLRIGTWDEQSFEKDRREMAESWQTPDPSFKPPAEIRIRLEKKVKDTTSMLEILVYGAEKRDYVKIGEVPLVLQSAGGGKGGLKVSFWVRGWGRERFTLGLDDVRIYEKRRR